MPFKVRCCAFPLLTLFVGSVLFLIQYSAFSTSVFAQPATFTAKPAFREVTLTGFTRARHMFAVVSEEDGRCLEVLADVGQPVPASGVFARLDPTFIDLQLAANRTEQKRLADEVAYLDKEAGRLRDLVARRTAAQSALDEIEYRLGQSNHRLRSLVIEEQVLRERRQRLDVPAPAGWLVIERSVEPGQWLGRGSVLGSVGDFGTLLVPFSLTPDEFRALESLPHIVLSLPEAAGGRKAEAVVERVSPAFDPATRKIGVDLAVEGRAAGSRGGVRVELVLPLPDPSGAVLVPEKAVVQRYEEFFLVTPTGERVPVTPLGPSGPGILRVRGDKAKVGAEFQAEPEP